MNSPRESQISSAQRGYDSPVAVIHGRPVAIRLAVKRAMDVFFAGFALILLSPLLAVIAAIVRLDTHGDVLERSTRVGLKGRHFIFYKFRTMVGEAKTKEQDLQYSPFFNVAAAPRLTRSGKWLRRFSLDELPQLWSVFLGDMSLVGPRPPDTDEIRYYRPQDMRTLDMPPGVTGLWQIKARLNPSFDLKMALDLEYINNWNLGLDCKILLKTIQVVFKGNGQ